MPDTHLEQAIYGGHDAGGYRFLARSPGFRDDWLPEAQRLCTGLGERPAGVAVPACVFAQPLGKDHVAVVQAADRGADDAGRPGALAFHLLVLPRPDYARLGGDPFRIAGSFPPPWDAREALDTLTWADEPLVQRPAAEIQRVLKREEGPSLLGGAQALLDGGKLRFERQGPDTELVRDLWMLLPTSTRCGLWPASFAFDTALGFHAVVVPPGVQTGEGYLTEDQAAEYPEGRYELCLQVAAEQGDQRELDALFARRSRAETWRLGVTLLCFLTVIVLVANWFSPAPPQAARPAKTTPEKLDLPADHYPTLTEAEKVRLTAALRDLATTAGLGPLPEGPPEALLAAVAERLGPGVKGRDPGEDLSQGPVQRRLRALLWKHGVAEYRDPNLNAVELVERLARARGNKRDPAK
jgi:hypothetical protein